MVESGVQSLLFEYKNYEGQVTSAWYLLLAMGNYSKITPELLKWVNAKIFPDQDLLKSIYQWLLPTYRSVFEDLTYEEQLLITAKLESARQFVLLACQQKSLKQYKLWLKNIKCHTMKSGVVFLVGGCKKTMDHKRLFVLDRSN